MQGLRPELLSYGIICNRLSPRGGLRPHECPRSTHRGHLRAVDEGDARTHCGGMSLKFSKGQARLCVTAVALIAAIA